jgi:hypothetical protein
VTVLSIKVYRVDAQSGERREVSQREWSNETLPFEPLMSHRWPPCQCSKCKDEGTAGELRRRR